MRIENGKQIPEKDDIYKRTEYDEDIIFRVIDIDFEREEMRLIDNQGINIWIRYISLFMKNVKYLGKAKNSLESIFEVEE